MTRTEALKGIRAMGMKVKITEDGEFRVNYPGADEATAYYTDDPEDAYETAKAMKTWKSATFAQNEN